LPVPAGKFVLMLRMYWRNEKSPETLNGTWKIAAGAEGRVDRLKLLNGVAAAAWSVTDRMRAGNG
jgi:hypothetical protein